MAGLTVDSFEAVGVNEEFIMWASNRAVCTSANLFEESSKRLDTVI